MAEESRQVAGRRQVLQALASSVGAGLAAPSLAQGAGAQHAHPAQSPPGADATSVALSAPAFLDERQLETLKSLAEAIVPGSSEARVAPFVDRLLAVEPRERQQEFLTALGAIQAESIARFGRSWLSLEAPEQNALLTAAATGPSSRTRRYGVAGEPEFTPRTLRDRFDLIKERIATAYYSSEKGMRELGWTGQMVHAELPGCTHPDGHGSSD